MSNANQSVSADASALLKIDFCLNVAEGFKTRPPHLTDADKTAPINSQKFFMYLKYFMITIYLSQGLMAIVLSLLLMPLNAVAKLLVFTAKICEARSE